VTRAESRPPLRRAGLRPSRPGDASVEIHEGFETISDPEPRLRLGGLGLDDLDAAAEYLGIQERPHELLVRAVAEHLGLVACRGLVRAELTLKPTRA
jgi:hypothetical protein